MLVFVDGERTDKCKFVDLPDFDVGLSIEGDEKVSVGDDVELDDVDVVDDFVDE